jgi:hypothetical protein
VLACNCRDVVVLPFTEVGLLKVASYGDDPVGTGHLEFEVGVVGDGHKLGVVWSTQDGVVGAGEIRYFKGECFHAEVGSTSKRHG